MYLSISESQEFMQLLFLCLTLADKIVTHVLVAAMVRNTLCCRRKVNLEF